MMPQEFQCLRCCECQTFQVHQVKKAKKWTCKICNQKQSIIKVFGQGTGADCRHHVQKLNKMREVADNSSFRSFTQRPSPYLQHDESEPMPVLQSSAESRWDHFLDDEEENCGMPGNDHPVLPYNYSDAEVFTTNRQTFDQHKKGNKRKEFEQRAENLPQNKKLKNVNWNARMERCTSLPPVVTPDKSLEEASPSYQGDCPSYTMAGTAITRMSPLLPCLPAQEHTDIPYLNESGSTGFMPSKIPDEGTVTKKSFHVKPSKYGVNLCESKQSSVPSKWSMYIEDRDHSDEEEVEATGPTLSGELNTEKPAPRYTNSGPFNRKRFHEPYDDQFSLDDDLEDIISSI